MPINLRSRAITCSSRWRNSTYFKRVEQGVVCLVYLRIGVPLFPCHLVCMRQFPPGSPASLVLLHSCSDHGGSLQRQSSSESPFALLWSCAFTYTVHSYGTRVGTKNSHCPSFKSLSIAPPRFSRLIIFFAFFLPAVTLVYLLPKLVVLLLPRLPSRLPTQLGERYSVERQGTLSKCYSVEHTFLKLSHPNLKFMCS